jgi:hypothetical protein
MASKVGGTDPLSRGDRTPDSGGPLGKSGGPSDWMTCILPSTSLSEGRPSFPLASTEITIGA